MWKIQSVWKILSLVAIVLGASLAFGLTAEEAATAVTVLPTEGSAVLTQAEQGPVQAIPNEPSQDMPRLFDPRDSLPHQEALGPCLALAGETNDACDTGEELSAMRPCLAAGDCESLELWEKRLGHLRPLSATQAQPSFLQPKDPR